jgi:hypothetical protein
VLTASITRAMTKALMMDTVSTSETSVNFYQATRRNIPEESNLHALELIKKFAFIMKPEGSLK